MIPTGRWREPVLDKNTLKYYVSELKKGDFIDVPTCKMCKSGNVGNQDMPVSRAEVIGITDRLIIVRLPNGILDSITIKEYAIGRIRE